jgi:hypothetical protein
MCLLWYILAFNGVEGGCSHTFLKLSDHIKHYYLVEPGRNLYYVPALFSAPYMSNFQYNNILLSNAKC